MNLDARAAARLLCVSEDRIYEWVAGGVLPSFTVQEELRFNRIELLEWATARRMRIAPELFQEQRPRSEAGTFLLSRALERGGIRRGVEAADARAALRAIVAGLELPPGIDRETVAALFAAQETLVPVGGGVAIPHARAPVVLPLKDPLVALAFLARPVPSTARDGGPIGAAFAVFSPTVRIHLHVLSKIGQALNDDATHALIARRAPDAELLARLREVEAAAPRATLPGPAGPGASAEEAR